MGMPGPLTVLRAAKKMHRSIDAVLQHAHILGIDARDKNSELSQEDYRAIHKVIDIPVSTLETTLGRAPDRHAIEPKSPKTVRTPSPAADNKLVRKLEQRIATLEGQATRIQAELSRLGAKDAISDSGSKELRIISERMQQVLQSLSTLDERLASCEEEVKQHVSHAAQDRATAQRMIKQWDDAADASARIQAPHLQFDPVAFASKLEARGLFYEPQLLSACATALTTKGVLILVGPPGTGKTELAKALASMVTNWTQPFEVHREEVFETWTSFEISGDKWLVGDRIVPHPGVLAEAVIKCVQKRGEHWLFLDEFNRANMELAVAGIMDTLEKIGRGAKLANPGSPRAIHIPDSFRLICAMNDADERHLFPISDGLLQRCNYVKVDPPSIELERRIVNAQCRDAITSLESPLARSHAPSRAKSLVTQEIERVLELVEIVRSSGRSASCRHSAFGSRPVVTAIQNAAAQKPTTPSELTKAFQRGVDLSISPCICKANSAALFAISDHPAVARNFPHLTSELQLELNRRNAFAIG